MRGGVWRRPLPQIGTRGGSEVLRYRTVPYCLVLHLSAASGATHGNPSPPPGLLLVDFFFGSRASLMPRTAAAAAVSLIPVRSCPALQLKCWGVHNEGSGGRTKLQPLLPGQVGSA